MKAITYSEYGPPDVLQLKDVSKPVPKDDELLIRVRAAEATKSDCEMRSFRFSVKWFWLPLRIALGVRRPKRQILGGYFSGEIAAVGKDVTRFSPGDQVFGAARLRLGAYAEYVALPASYTIVPKPSNMSFAEAAAVPLGGLTRCTSCEAPESSRVKRCWSTAPVAASERMRCRLPSSWVRR